MKTFIAFLKQMASRADYLLHHIVAGYILLLVFAILAHIIPWGWAMLAADAVAFLALLLKEGYDYFHQDKHSVEKEDILSGALAVAVIDILIVMTFAFL